MRGMQRPRSDNNKRVVVYRVDVLGGPRYIIPITLVVVVLSVFDKSVDKETNVIIAIGFEGVPNERYSERQYAIQQTTISRELACGRRGRLRPMQSIAAL